MANISIKIVLFCLICMTRFALVSCVNATCRQDCCGMLDDRPPQTFYFYQNTGRFTGGTDDYAINTKTYAGAGQGLLNPAKQCVKNVGPPPVNTYKLTYCKNTMHKQKKIRPCSFYMQPQDEKQMCQRFGFFVHGCGVCTQGDDSEPPKSGCSEGCIIMNFANRKKLRLGDTLIVVAEDPE